MKLPIYMDHHATTPVDPKVFEAMRPYFTENFGNAASKSHSFGWKAEAAVEKARGQVARCIGAAEDEIFFTSGATESNNVAVLGVAEGYRAKGNHIVTVATEHKAILDPCQYLANHGFEITYLPVDAEGFVDPDQLKKAIGKQTILISVMAANNEIGTLQAIAEVGKIARAREVLFHTDAAQAIGKIPMDVDSMNLDLLSLSGHKVYGPKGVGALYLHRKSPRLRIPPRFYGGGHEGGLRSGTLDVPGVVGLGAALEIAQTNMAEESERISKLRDRLQERIFHSLDEVYLNGPRQRRLSNNLNLSFAGVVSDALMMEMKEVAVSSGSACTSASPKPSHVLKALGWDDDRIKSSIRFGLGRFNTEAEVDYVAEKIANGVRELRRKTLSHKDLQEGIDLRKKKWNARPGSQSG